MSDFGDAVGAYGAGLATVVALVQIRQMMRARPRLRLAIGPEDDSPPSHPDRAEFVVSAVNAGGIPITVVRARLVTEHTAVWDYELPDQTPPLAPTRAWRKEIRGRDLVARLKAADPHGTIASLSVSDSTGRTWQLDLRRAWSRFPEVLPQEVRQSARWRLVSRLRIPRRSKSLSDGQ